jgi:hypothetical protein
MLHYSTNKLHLEQHHKHLKVPAFSPFLSLHIPLTLTDSALYPLVFVVVVAATAAAADDDDNDNTTCEI